MMNEDPAEDFKGLQGLSFFAISGLALIILLRSLEAFFGFAQAISPSSTIDLDESTTSSLWALFQGLIALAYMPIILFSGVSFLIWLRRANKNLTALRADYVQYSPGWAVGWWFIPFLNLVRPFQVVREVWWESDPDADIGDDRGPNFVSTSLRRAPTFMALWWAFWILSNFASNVAGMMFNGKGLDAASLGFAVGLSGFLAVIAAALAIRVVREITSRQDARYAAIGKMQQPSPVPPPPIFGAGY